MVQVPDQGFAIKGLTYPQTKQNTNAKVDIAIPEQGCCISMPGVSGAFGTPIDAELAIDSIRKFQNHFRLYGDKDEKHLIEQKPEKLVEMISGLHKKLVKLNYGMTMDKNMALKLLSQPGCEGIRFYLCSKKVDGVDEISLVSVGVNCLGFDLNYNNPKIITYAPVGSENVFLPKMGDVPAIANISTESLVGDYVTPPKGIEDSFINKGSDSRSNITEKTAYQDCFVLLNLATHHKITA